MPPVRKTRQVTVGNVKIGGGALVRRRGRCFAIIGCAVIGVCDAAGAEDWKPTVFKSSVLGFSLEVPAGWAKTVPTGCGSGYVGKTEEELLRMPVYPVAFRSEGLSAQLYIRVWRKFDGGSARRLKWLTQGAAHERSTFHFANGRRGQRIFVRRDLADALIVITGAGERRFELSFLCPHERFEAARATFEQIARSLDVFEPALDLPVPGVFKRLKGDGFVLHYPGEWVWQRPWDDEQARTPRSVYVKGPKLASQWMPHVHISAYRGPKKAKTLEELMHTIAEHADRTDGLEFAHAPFETNGQRKGSRCVYTIDLPAGLATTTIIYLFELGSEELVSVSCVCPADRVAEFEETFDQIGKRLELD